MSKVLVQILTAMAVGLGNISLGYMIVWPSYTIPIFQGPTNPLTSTITTSHETLLGSTPMLGSLLGTLFGGAVGDAFGRKKGLILCALLPTLGWAIICTTRDVYILIASRIFLGVAGGLYSGIFTLFIGEISAVAIRGSLISIAAFGYPFGVLVSYVMGWLFSYNVGNYAILGVNVLFTLLMIVIKETPMFLLRNGRDTEAMTSLKFYRQSPEATQELLDELSEIKNLLQKAQQPSSSVADPEKEKLQQDNAEPPSSEIDTGNPWKQLFSSPASLRTLFTICLLISMAVSSGMVSVQTYAGSLFARTTPDLSPNLCSVLLAVANIAGGVVAMFLSDIAGRRKLMVSSCVLISLCLATLGVLLRWSIAPYWMIPAVVLLYCFCYQFGVGSVPYILNSECYLPEVKSICILIAFSSMWIFNFISLAIFQPCIDLVGLNGTFFLFAIVAGLTAVLSFLIVPETSGLSLPEIRELFEHGLLQVGRSRRLKYARTKTIEE